MAIIYDQSKSEKNVTDRGLSFDLVERFDWLAVFIEEDTRKNYGERRYQIWGLIGGRLHIAVVAPRGPDLRVISLRKANKKEVVRYDETNH